MKFGDIFKKSFLTGYTSDITIQYAAVAMIVCLIISVIIAVVYYFKSKKRFFSKEFLLSILTLSVITTGIILTIQSSIVVSLGMVGALSIVRFRTAVKSSLDLVFLFWAISVGIICGAGLFYIAIVLSIIVAVVILLVDDLPSALHNRILVIEGNGKFDIKEIKLILSTNTRHYNIKTESVNVTGFNLIVEVKFSRNYDVQEIIDKLINIEYITNVSFLKQEGILN